MSNLRYNRGANFERAVKKYLEQQGGDVFRVAGSHTPADIIALFNGKIYLTQCKLDGYCPPSEREALKDIAIRNKAIAQIAYRNKGIKFKEVE